MSNVQFGVANLWESKQVRPQGACLAFCFGAHSLWPCSQRMTKTWTSRTGLSQKATVLSFTPILTHSADLPLSLQRISRRIPMASQLLPVRKVLSLDFSHRKCQPFFQYIYSVPPLYPVWYLNKGLLGGKPYCDSEGVWYGSYIKVSQTAQSPVKYMSVGCCWF